MAQCFPFSCWLIVCVCVRVCACECVCKGMWKIRVALASEGCVHIKWNCSPCQVRFAIRCVYVTRIKYTQRTLSLYSAMSRFAWFDFGQPLAVRYCSCNWHICVRAISSASGSVGIGLRGVYLLTQATSQRSNLHTYSYALLSSLAAIIIIISYVSLPLPLSLWLLVMYDLTLSLTLHNKSLHLSW